MADVGSGNGRATSGFEVERRLETLETGRDGMRIDVRDLRCAVEENTRSIQRMGESHAAALQMVAVALQGLRDDVRSMQRTRIDRDSTAVLALAAKRKRRKVRRAAQ